MALIYRVFILCKPRKIQGYYTVGQQSVETPWYRKEGERIPRVKIEGLKTKRKVFASSQPSNPKRKS